MRPILVLAGSNGVLELTNSSGKTMYLSFLTPLDKETFHEDLRKCTEEVLYLEPGDLEQLKELASAENVKTETRDSVGFNLKSIMGSIRPRRAPTHKSIAAVFQDNLKSPVLKSNSVDARPADIPAPVETPAPIPQATNGTGVHTHRRKRSSTLSAMDIGPRYAPRMSPAPSEDSESTN